jgi:hypothetical protein
LSERGSGSRCRKSQDQAVLQIGSPLATRTRPRRRSFRSS